MPDNKYEALNYLIKLSQEQGYLTFDNILDASDEYNLSISATDWLSSSLTDKGIILYEEVPSISNSIVDTEETSYSDYSQIDYSEVFNRIVEIDSSLAPIVDEVKNILPAQYKEISKLKYQLFEGNKHARERMIEIHLRQALKFALKRAELYDLPLAETIGDAFCGLVTACDRYNPNENGAFASYATMWMMQYITRNQSTQRIFVYYPVHKKEPYFAAYPALKQHGCLECADIQYCDKARMIVQKQTKTSDSFEDIINQLDAWPSFDEYLEYESDDAQKLLSIKSDDETHFLAEEKARKELINKALSTLREREKQVIELRFGLIDNNEMTLEEVGKKLGITRERVRQIEGKAMQKLGRLSFLTRDF